MDDVFTTCFREFCPVVCGMMGARVGLLVGMDGKCVGNLMADIENAERDSRKDEAVVFIFIFATAGLLIWAAIRPWVGKWVDVSSLCGILKFGATADNLSLQSARERRSYIPVSTQGDG